VFDPADPGPDYELGWPAALFRAEATALASLPRDRFLTADAELLLEEAFTSSTPKDDLQTSLNDSPWGRLLPPANPHHHEQQQAFLLRLASEADQLPHRTNPRRYWSSRRGAPPAVTPLVVPPAPPAARAEQMQRDWAATVGDLLERGYLDRTAERDCVDNRRPQQEDVLNRETVDRLGLDRLWPLRPGSWDEDTFHSLIEVVHDLVARPRHRWWHDYSGCGWHYSRFAAAPGRALYRWHVDRLLARHDVPLRMATSGEDIGRLVRVAGDGRDELAARVMTVDAERGTREHAVALFRGRGAGVPEKRSAVVALAGMLEERRELLRAELLSRDEGALFEIANRFDLRHRRADQRGDYAEAYLDWICWWYLATLDLTDQLLARQATAQPAGP
jgi:hypothetical protein